MKILHILAILPLAIAFLSGIIYLAGQSGWGYWHGKQALRVLGLLLAIAVVFLLFFWGVGGLLSN